MIEVDVDGSVVQVRTGRYDDDTLGRLMSAAPFFEALCALRYAPENRKTQTLVTCTSCQQAYDCVKYLADHKPEFAPKPELILGTTDAEKRRRILEHFKAGGAVDTVVSCRTLIEGFDAPRCKLLFDLSPSASRVTATQKFCRVLTRFEDEEARIYCFVPKKLALPPILPMELLLPLEDNYDAGTLIASKKHAKSEPTRLHHPRIHPIVGVEVKSRIVIETHVEKPKLDAKNYPEVRQVLLSHKAVSLSQALPFSEFRGLLFQHELFTGRGDHLIRFCGFKAQRESYQRFLERYCPEAAAGVLLKQDSGEIAPWRDEALQWFELRYGRLPKSRKELRRALADYMEPGPPEREMPIDEDLDCSEMLLMIKAFLADQTRFHLILSSYFAKEMSFKEIGIALGYRGGGMVGKYYELALSFLRRELYKVGALYETESFRFEPIPPNLPEQEHYRRRAFRNEYVRPPVTVNVPEPKQSQPITEPRSFQEIRIETLEEVIETYGREAYDQLIRDVLAIRSGRYSG